jgi:ammonium transporter Rh
VLGKVNQFQLVFMAIFELFFYTLNEHIAIQEIRVTDIGGSMIIHLFGAIFGIGVSLMYRPKSHSNHPLCGSNYYSNLFAMIGTLFLWMYWPSFNAILASPSG